MAGVEEKSGHQTIEARCPLVDLEPTCSGIHIACEMIQLSFLD
jgi:hypothetical protein